MRVTIVDSLCRELFPHMRSLPHCARMHVQSQQRFQRLLRRSAFHALAAAHLEQLIEMRQVRHAGAPYDAIHPAFHQRQQVLDGAEHLLLLRCLVSADTTEIDRAGQRLGIHGIRVAQLGLHQVGVDGNGTGVFVDERFETRRQPCDRVEKPRMGYFDEREELHDLTVVQFEFRRIILRILHDERTRRVGSHGQALVERPMHFRRHVAGDGPQLQRERQASHEAQDVSDIHVRGNGQGDGAGEHAGDLAVEMITQTFA